MTDKTLTENDDTEELIVVETPTDREPDPEPEDDKKPAPVAEDDDDDDSDDDERVGTSEDDNEEDVTAANRARRRKRRQLQKMAREKTERELAFLRDRLAHLEGRVVNTDVQTLEQKIAKTHQEIQQAEFILGKAVDAANGEDVAAAMRIRDELKDELRNLTATKQQMAQPRQAPQVDPRVVNYAQQWMTANPWYDPQGRDRESAVTKAIDAELVRDGYDPASRDYWEELTARVADAFGGNEEPAKKQTTDRPKRKAPPTGTTREHAPQSTKREIYVTPERKQAMIDAGVWDDPVLRQRYLKAYQAYDTGSAR